MISIKSIGQAFKKKSLERLRPRTEQLAQTGTHLLNVRWKVSCGKSVTEVRKYLSAHGVA
jgi:hypothetical protein